MKPQDDMPMELAIEMYFEKHHALRMGNLTRLIELKQQHPQIFDKAKDKEIRDIIIHAKAFEKSEHYLALRRLEIKESLATIVEEPNIDP